jgi:glycosyltransferase involved in cell wall biosynthesis
MISILIPIYNGVEFIEESVSSVLNQTYDQWELLIGINGHPENSDIYKIAKEYEKKSGKIRVFDFYTIRGKSNALNEMISFCKYNYVAILDVDDVWHPQKLEVQSNQLEKYDVIGSNCVWFGDRPGIVPQIPTGDISDYDFSLVNPIINSSSVIRKELSYWNKVWDGVEDYDMWLRLRKQNKKFYNFKEILVKHRIHNSSAFNSKGNDNKVEGLLKSYGLSREMIIEEPKNTPTFVMNKTKKKVQMNSKNKIKMKIINYN